MIYQVIIHFGKGHDEKYHLSRSAVWRTLNDRLLYLKASYSKHVFHIRFLANMTANFAYDNSQIYIIHSKFLDFHTFL